MTSGPYRFARHPMYAVVLLWPVITLLQTANWLYSLSWAIGICYAVSRCRKEERLMQEIFGDQYRDYMNSVGPFFPCTIPFWGNITTEDYSPLSFGDNQINDDNDLFDD